jgi:hypothetical protein
MRTNRAPTAEGRAAHTDGAGEPVHVLDCWQMLSALHGTDCIAASPTFDLSGAVRRPLERRVSRLLDRCDDKLRLSELWEVAAACRYRLLAEWGETD